MSTHEAGGRWRDEIPAPFDTHTAVEVDQAGTWTARLAPELTGFGGTHGGYIAAIALRSMTMVVGEATRTPRSLTIQLLASLEPGRVSLLPSPERHGSSMSAASVRIEQRGELRCSALALFGSSRPSISYLGIEMPNVPGPERCEPLLDKPAPEARAGLLVEHRPAAPPLPLSGAARAEILVWMRLLENRPLDVFQVAMLADAGPPALFAHLTRFIPMPSVEMNIHFGTLKDLNESPWVLGVYRTLRAEEGYAIEDSELWTRDGQPLLQMRQLRRVLTSRSITGPPRKA